MFSKLLELTPSQLKNWEKIRVKGKNHFVLYRGILGWGLYMFIVLTIFNHLQQVDFDFSSLNSISLPILIINFIVCSIGGWFFGVLTWANSEKSFLENRKG